MMFGFDHSQHRRFLMSAGYFPYILIKKSLSRKKAICGGGIFISVGETPVSIREIWGFPSKGQMNGKQNSSKREHGVF